MGSIIFKVLLQKENKELLMMRKKWAIKMIKSQISTTTKVAQIL